MYCCIWVTALLAVAGVIWIDTKAAAVMFKVAVFEVTPLSDAVMLEEPTATAVARPEALMVALLVSLEFHDTDPEMSGVLASV